MMLIFQNSKYSILEKRNKAKKTKNKDLVDVISDYECNTKRQQNI